MADLNKIMVDVQNQTKKTGDELRKLLTQYDKLFREANILYMGERSASHGSMEGLDDFKKLLFTIRRNKDVAGSLVRGMTSLRSMKKFQIIEEDVPDRRASKKKKPEYEYIPVEKRALEVKNG